MTAIDKPSRSHENNDVRNEKTVNYFPWERQNYWWSLIVMRLETVGLEGDKLSRRLKKDAFAITAHFYSSSWSLTRSNSTLPYNYTAILSIILARSKKQQETPFYTPRTLKAPANQTGVPCAMRWQVSPTGIVRRLEDVHFVTGDDSMG